MTPLKAIRAKCLDCCCGVMSEVRLCSMTDCPLHQFRPEISFLVYTKKYDMVNEYLDHHRIPSNLCVRFSMWDNTWIVPNPHNLPLSFVDFKDQTRNVSIPKNAFKCKGNHADVTCTSCGVCFNKKVKNVVFKQH